MLSVFDAHFHIIDPACPLWENNDYLPESFLVSQYLKRVESLSITSGAVVSGSFQRFDQSYLVEALRQLGGEFVGVTQLPASTPDDVILDLDQKGVRSVRFNLKRGGSESVSQLDSFARRVYELAGWHIELYADFHSLKSLKSVLCRLPAVSVDHLGLDKDGLPLLAALAEKGVRVKATGFGRLTFDPLKAIRNLYAINPDALMFGTDLPSTRAPSPFEDSHLEQIIDALGTSGAKKVCWSNARAFYRLKEAT